MFQSEPIRDYLVWNSRCIIFESNVESDDFLQISIMCQILFLNSLEMGILVKEKGEAEIVDFLDKNWMHYNNDVSWKY